MKFMHHITKPIETGALGQPSGTAVVFGYNQQKNQRG